MTPFKTALLVVLIISLTTFIAFFGRLPAFRGTPIGFLHRVLWIHLPNGFKWLDLKIANGKISAGGAKVGNYLLYEKHPLVVIFFLGLLSGSAILFIPAAWPYLSTGHRLLIPILLPLPYVFTYLSARRSSSPYITHENHDEYMRQYPYDRILYYPGNECRTCRFLKPARSKHCSICRTCVARLDHHCIWVNNCLGRGNYRHFLSLLFFTSILLAYGAYLAYVALSPQLETHFQRYANYYATLNQVPRNAGLLERLRIRFHSFTETLNVAMSIGGIPIAAVGLLAFFTWPMPLGLLAYHVYLIWAGMTTNESSKWGDWREDMNDGVVFMGWQKEEKNIQINREAEPPTTWPLRSRQTLVRTEDGQPPNWLPKSLAGVVEEGSWRRCWKLRDVENVYDLGFWDNLREAFA